MNDSNIADEVLRTPQEIARIMRVHVATVRRYREEEGLPFYRLGGKDGKVRYKLSEVEAWMTDRHQSGKDQVKQNLP